MNSLDPSNMYRMIEDYPLQFTKGLALATHIQLQHPVNQIILTGMGGSALAGDLVNISFPGLLRQPLIISRNYHIPYQLDSATLVIANSFSGNTEETIAAYHQARATGAQVVVIASGGKLLELALQDKTPVIKSIKESDNFQPRMSSGYIFAILVSLLVKSGHLPSSVETELLALPVKLTTIDTRSSGQRLGEELSGTIPLIYSADDYWPVARIAKIKLNENSKVPAFWNYLPEMNHNELVGFSHTSDHYQIVMLRDRDSDPRINRRMQVVADILKSQPTPIPTIFHDMLGQDRLTKIFSTLMVMDWASYYLALKLGVDPTPVQMVEDFKQLMS